MDIFTEVREIICQQLKAKPEEITPEDSFIGDSGSDLTFPPKTAPLAIRVSEW